MIKNKPRIPLWEEIYEKVALDYVRDVEKVLPNQVEIGGINDDTFYKIGKINNKYWKYNIVRLMPLRLRTRFKNLVKHYMYYSSGRKLTSEWELGKEYLHLRKKL